MKPEEILKLQQMAVETQAKIREETERFNALMFALSQYDIFCGEDDEADATEPAEETAHG